MSYFLSNIWARLGYGRIKVVKVAPDPTPNDIGVGRGIGISCVKVNNCNCMKYAVGEIMIQQSVNNDTGQWKNLI